MNKSNFIPEIRGFDAEGWEHGDFCPLVPQISACTLYIGDIDNVGIDYFHFCLVNSRWVHYQGLTVFLVPSWIERTVLCANEWTTDGILQIIKKEIDLIGPYDSWEDFGSKIRPYLHWEKAPYEAVDILLNQKS